MTCRRRLAPRLGLALLPALLLPLLPGAARGDCGPPDRLPYAELADAFKDQTTFPVNSSVQYVCRPGYRRDPSLEAARICRAGSLWSRPEKFCIAKLCGHPGDLPDGSVHIETDLSFGSTVTFSCNEGYRLIGPQFARCEIAGKGVHWNEEIPHCQSIPCLPPPDIENGKHSGEQEDYTYGASVTYKCNNVPRGSVPFSLIGEATIYCRSNEDNNGVWSAPAPQCKVVKCPEPAVPNGRRETAYSPDYIYRSRVIMKCLPDYVMIGSDVIECQENNTWHPELPVCLRMSCDHPGDLQHGSVHTETGLGVNSTVTFSCNDGYRLIGPQSIRCVLFSKHLDWDRPIPHCQPIPCLPPPDIENGKHSGEQENYTYGASVTYKCNDVPRGSVPFSLIGEAAIHCSSDAEKNGVWSAPAPRCKVVKCPEPAVPNGRRETAYSPDYIYRSRVTMKCLPGYVMIGSDVIECQEDNTWHPGLPVCQTTVSVSSASTPTATVLVIAHGRIIDGPKPPYAVGDNITIECDAGYTLHGEAKIQYVGGNQWKPGIPSCHLKEGLSTGVIVTLCIVFGALVASLAGYGAYKKLHSRKRESALQTSTAKYSSYKP
ncbi:complement component receptor 1-like protein isoform X2 [Alligator mississippiensis]|uniref:complement component receptor 1-like protein isoform X2 n=1 Tax=Alligator mississippiensis TaxID=8496 RepID=UPI002877AF5E|nr:complement component receptor 1-like protein isoform X2 [Alligator mississippiensis]